MSAKLKHISCDHFELSCAELSSWRAGKDSLPQSIDRAFLDSSVSLLHPTSAVSTSLSTSKRSPNLPLNQNETTTVAPWLNLSRSKCALDDL